MKRTLYSIALTCIALNVFSQATEKEFSKIKGKIFPIIKVTTSNGQPADIKFTGENELIFKPVVGDLVCFYGVDKGDYFEILPKSKVPATITADDLDAIAKANLIKGVSKNLQIHTTDFNAYGFSCGGDHEAALILVPEIWNILKERLGNKIVFGVASKDMAIYVHADKPDEIAGLRKMVDDIHKDGGKVLSKSLFLYDDGTLSVYNAGQ